MERRTVLRTLGAGLVAGSLSGCSTFGDTGRWRQPPDPGETPTARSETPRGTDESTEPSDELERRFDTVIDVQAAGADATGGERIDALIHDLAGDDTLLKFPPGRYRLGQLRLHGYRNFGMVGSDATLVADRRGRGFLITAQRVSDFHLEGFTVDASASNTAAWCDVRCIGGTNVVRDYTVRGFVDVPERTNAFTLMVERKDTSLELDRVNLPDGGLGAAAAFVFPRTSFEDPSREPGTLTFRDCVMRGWGVEGLYASAHSGPLNVIGGEYANNAIVQVRVGGGNAPNRTLVRDVTVVVDDVPNYFRKGKREFRGIWLKEGDLGTVENCDVRITGVPSGGVQAGIVVNQQFGRSVVRDTSIQMDVASPAILVEKPTTTFNQIEMPAMERLPDEWHTELRDLTVATSGSRSPAVVVDGREGCVIDGLDVEASGTGADGILFQKAPGCTIEGGSFVADRYPVLAIGPPDAQDCWVSLDGLPHLETATVTERGYRLVDAMPTTSTPLFPDVRFCIRPADVPGFPQDYDVLALTETNAGALYGRTYDLNELPGTL